jgi:endonuclease III
MVREEWNSWVGQLARSYEGKPEPGDDKWQEEAFGKPISYYLADSRSTKSLCNHLIRNESEWNALTSTVPDRMHHILDPGRPRWQYLANLPLQEHLCNSSLYWKRFVLRRPSPSNSSVYKAPAIYKTEKRIILEYLKVMGKSDISLYVLVPPSSLYYVGTFRDNAWKDQDNDDILKKMLHQLILRLHKCIERHYTKYESIFLYGSGAAAQEWRFCLPEVDKDSCDYVDKHTAGDGQFSPLALERREQNNGHPALSAPLNRSVPWATQRRLDRWTAWLRLADHIPRCRYQYKLVKELYQAAQDHSLNPLRADWLQVIPARCEKDCEKDRWRINPPKCRGCSKMMAQAAIVVFCAQGVGDANILPYLGAVFRHPRYANWTVQEWARVCVYELATILKPCSAQGVKAHYLLSFFKYVHEEKPPETVKRFSCIYGLGKKSACLLLSATKGHPVGIPVDRHLQSAFRNLRWAPRDETDCTLMSEMVEFWLPYKHWSEINDEIAGIRQLYRDNSTRKTLLQVGNSLTFEHREILNILVADMRVSANSANPPREHMLWGVWAGNADLPIIPQEVVGDHILPFL